MHVCIFLIFVCSVCNHISVAVDFDLDRSMTVMTTTTMMIKMMMMMSTIMKKIIIMSKREIALTLCTAEIV